MWLEWRLLCGGVAERWGSGIRRRLNHTIAASTGGHKMPLLHNVHIMHERNVEKGMYAK